MIVEIVSFQFISKDKHQYWFKSIDRKIIKDITIYQST